MDQEDVSELYDKLKDLSGDLNPAQRDLLKGILAVARRLTEGTSEPAAGSFRAGFGDAFDPLPAEKVQRFLEYKDSPAMIVRREEPAAGQGNAMFGSGTVVDPNTPIVFEEG